MFQKEMCTKKTWALTRMKVLANFLAEDAVPLVTWWACLTRHTFPLGAVQNLPTVRLVETRVGAVVQTKVDWLVKKIMGKGVSCDIGLEQACHLGIFMNIREKLKAKNLKLRNYYPPKTASFLKVNEHFDGHILRQFKQIDNILLILKNCLKSLDIIHYISRSTWL